MHIDTMSAMVGAALPASAMTLSCGSMSAAASNHSTLATKSPPMAQPYAMLSK